MKTISLTNFQKMSPSVPQYSDKNQHQYIVGVNPLYYLATMNEASSNVQEEQISPLYPSTTLISQATNARSSTYSDIISVPSRYGDYVSADNGGYVQRMLLSGLDDNNVFGSTSGNVTLADFAGFVWAMSWANGASSSIQYANYDSGAWTNLTSIPSHSGYGGWLVPFQNQGFLMVCFGEYIYTIDQTLTISGSAKLALGAGWYIACAPEMYANGNYAVIAAYKSENVSTLPTNNTYIGNALFFWNGSGTTVQYKIELPGMFIGMKSINGNFYVIVEEIFGFQTLYKIVGYSLKRIMGLTGISSSVTRLGIRSNCCTNVNGYLGIESSKGLVLFKEDSDIGNVLFQYDTTSNYNKIIIAGSSAKLYALKGSTIYYDNLGSNTATNTISYTSQWISIQNLKRIDVYYETPPNSGTDAINVTIYGKGKNSGATTTSLKSITSTSFLNSQYTSLDVGGFTGDRVKVVLTTVNSGTWIPIIRQIDLIHQG